MGPTGDADCGHTFMKNIFLQCLPRSLPAVWSCEASDASARSGMLLSWASDVSASCMEE